MATPKIPVIFAVVTGSPPPKAWFLPSPDYPSYIGLGALAFSGDFRARPTLLEEPVVTVRGLPAILGGGRSDRSVSAIRVAWEAGDDDDVLTSNWRGWTIQIHAAFPDSTDPAAEVALGVSTALFFGRVRDLTWTQDILSIVAEDATFDLDTPISTNKYGGGGGADGDPELEDVLKPVMIGEVRHAQAVLVEASTQLYQYHDGDATGALAVYDGGVLVTQAAGTFADAAALLAWSAVPGEVAEAPAVGMFRLGAVPSSVVTVTADGMADASLPTGGTGSVTTLRQLVYALLVDFGGISAPDVSGVPNPVTVSGFYTGTQPTMVSEALPVVLQSEAALVMRADALGGFSFILLTKPADPSSGPVLRESQILAIARTSSLRLPGSVRVAHTRSWTTLSEDQILSGATDAERRLLEEPFRFSEVDFSRPEEAFELATLLESAASAQTVGTVVIAPWLDDGYDPLTIFARDIPDDWELGTEITIESPRFTAIDRGWRIVGLSRQIAQGFGTIEVIG